MRVETVTCDGCEADLTYTHNIVDYRLLLTYQGKSAMEGPDRLAARTLMNIPAPLDQIKHFCGLKCLEVWVAKTIAADVAG